MPARVSCFVASAALLVGVAGAQEESPTSARGWEVGRIYRVHVERKHRYTANTRYPEELRWPREQRNEEFGYRFRYLDRIDAVGENQVSAITRHYVKAVRVEGERELPLALEGRQLQVELPGRGVIRIRGYDGAEVAPEWIELAELSVFPVEPTELGPPRKQNQGLANIDITKDWPGSGFQFWPRVVTRCVSFGWAPSIGQGKWLSRFEGDLQPLGSAHFEFRAFGEVETEDDGIPVVVTRGREVELDVDITASDAEELPLSPEVELQAVRDQAAAGELEPARKRLRTLREQQAPRWPEHLQAELAALEAELR